MEQVPTKVIIIGSGISGLSCARHLADNTNFDITILEANPDRYGGRIWSYEVPGYPGKYVELGAMWIHEGRDPKHPLRSIFEKFNVQDNDVGELRFVQCFDQHGNLYTTEKLDQLLNIPKKLNSIRDEMIEKNLADVSFAEAMMKLDCGNDEFVRLLFTPIQESYQGSVKEKISFLYADGIPNCPESAELNGTDIIVKDGYRKILDYILKNGRKFEIRLGQNVTDVIYNGNNNKIEIKCINTIDGSNLVYQIDHVVVAVPLSILKAGSISFQPELPSCYKTAVERIGIDNKFKVLIVFDKVFWPKNKAGFTFESSNPTGFPTIMDNLYFANGVPGLLVTISGEGVTAAETMAQDQIIDKILNCLGIMFGKFVVKNSKIVFYKIVNWAQQPYINAAYSYSKIGMKPEDAYNIRKPIRPYLYFAGEHTAFPENLHGAATGAYVSGIRAAKEIIVDKQCAKLVPNFLKCRL